MLANAFETGFRVAKESLTLFFTLWAYYLIANFLQVFKIHEIHLKEAPEIAVIALALLVLFVFSLFFHGGMLGYVREKMQGREAGIATLCRLGSRFFLPMLGIAGLWLLAFAILAACVFIALFGLTYVHDLQLARIFSIATIVVAALIALYVGVIMSLSPYFVVMDEQGAWEGIGKAKKLVCRRFTVFLRICVVGLVLVLISGLLAALAVLFKGHHTAEIVYFVVNNGIIAYFAIVTIGAVMKLCYRVN